MVNGEGEGVSNKNLGKMMRIHSCQLHTMARHSVEVEKYHKTAANHLI